jgi:pimeloyl-ACP methyl ester carboxylesterase
MPPTPATNSDLWHSDEGSGPAVLVIHGAGSNGRMWATDLEPLTQSHRLITFNRRGYPGSGAAPRDWRAHAADAAELVVSLEVAPVAVVAHSSGAIAALELAVCRPELVGSLVLLDPAFGAAHNLTPAFAGAVVKARLLWLVGRRRQAIDGWLRFVTSYSTGGSAFERMGEERREALRANAEGVFADLASGDGSHISAAELASIRAPVNIVTATLSPAFLQKTSAALAKRLPSATTRSLPGSGHAMAFDQPDELLAELRIALDGASSSPAVDG